jgi:hypothetical protein
MAVALTIIGQLLTLLGAGIGAWVMKVNPEEAVKVTVSRWAGTPEENLQAPTAQNLLRQFRLTAIAFGIIAAGTALQIIGTWLL